MVMSIKVNEKMVKDMEKANYNKKKVISMKVIEKMGKGMVMVELSILMAKEMD